MTALADDIDRIMTIMATAFDPAYGEAWNRRQVEDALLPGNCHYLLIDAQSNIMPPDSTAVGFALSRTGFDEEELLLFAVDPLFRGYGLGKRMLNQFADNARVRSVTRLLLEMRAGNPAERMYLDFGFVPVGKRTNYYRTPAGDRIDAITFACDLE
jgi:[ribosomal protein S18]-alanine N-acetyltransferase